MFCSCGGVDLEGLEEPTDGFSYVGKAAYEKLRSKHSQSWRENWSLSSGRVVGRVQDTPQNTWADPTDPPEGHSDWLPQKMAEVMGKTQSWCDVSSLSPPDGLFMECMKTAMKTINATAKQKGGDPIIIRMIFGTFTSEMPLSILRTDCHAVLKELVQGIEEDDGCNLQVWVGTWRTETSWNHAKIIAVDGKHLYQGGHNMWTAHYLQGNPVHDLSMQAEGQCAHDGHVFLNKQWDFIKSKASSIFGRIVECFPDWMPMATLSHVAVSSFPVNGKTETFPPQYDKGRYTWNGGREHLPMITMGRYGHISQGLCTGKYEAPEDAFTAMFDAAKQVIRVAQQDIGPVSIDKIPVSGTWPANYLDAFGRALKRGVQIEIVLTTSGSQPGTEPHQAYGNGWDCADVASEIIKFVKDKVSDAAELERIMKNQVRLTYMRQAHKNAWEDGRTMAFHTKHFIVDDIAYYIGSQNFYACDLAEWGIVIDDADQTKKVIEEYWNPLWTNSYREGQDYNIDGLLEGYLNAPE